MKSLRKLGAGVAFLASAMMETNTLNAHSYQTCDGKFDGSCCAGLAKQNWFMARLCDASWRRHSSTHGGTLNKCDLAWQSGWGDSGYRKLLVLNRNPRLDISIYNRCRKIFSKREFFAGHRDGWTGLCQAQNTADINQFIEAYDWTVQQLRKYPGRNCRFWVNVQAI